MATIAYGDARYEVPDGMARHMQKVISAVLEEGHTVWYPVAVEPGEDDQQVIAQLLIGPGIPVSVSFTYETSDDLEAALLEDSRPIWPYAERGLRRST
ncbi:MAG TPA: hypothetical protein VFU36_12780 [Jatrophihabitans sp.]|nr:hypothetical protein [Jatrophihabitans sp.]